MWIQGSLLSYRIFHILHIFHQLAITLPKFRTPYSELEEYFEMWKLEIILPGVSLLLKNYWTWCIEAKASYVD